MKAGTEAKPKLPKHDKTKMYKQTYSQIIESHGGIVEKCAYSEKNLKGVDPNYVTHINTPMQESMFNFLKPLDSYGYKKILIEELLTQYAASAKVEIVAVRLADVIGPFDESFRMWKYVTWIKAHLFGTQANTTRLSQEQVGKVRSKQIWYEVPKDSERKLSLTFSVDVVKFI